MRVKERVNSRSRKGKWIERKNPIGTHFCPQPFKELQHSTCPKSISAKQTEAQVWEKVSQFITNPEYLLAQAKAKAAQFQRNYKQMQQEELQLQEEIKKLNDERQEFITKARKERMPDEEFTPQINALYEKELRVQRKLTTIERAKDDFTKLDMEEQVKKYVDELQSEMDELINANPQAIVERHQVFLLKKQILDRVLVEVSIDENRAIRLKFRTDFLG